MARRIVLLILFVLILTACGEIVAPAVTTTPPRPTPDPNAAQLPMGTVDLESLLFQSNDFPSGVAGGQITGQAGKIFETLPRAEQIKVQLIELDGVSIGGVTVFLYDTPATAQAAYAMAAEGLPEEARTVEGLGDVSLGAYRDREMFERQPGAAHLFQRCRALAYIVGDSDVEPGGAVQNETWISYAKRLDTRLSTVAC
jgi:hypothetical protein